MKVTNNMLSCVLFHLILKIFVKEAVFLIAKETEMFWGREIYEDYIMSKWQTGPHLGLLAPPN